MIGAGCRVLFGSTRVVLEEALIFVFGDRVHRYTVLKAAFLHIITLDAHSFDTLRLEHVRVKRFLCSSGEGAPRTHINR